MTAKYHAVLFDFDYTLGDTERGIVASTRYALEQMDLPQPPEEAIRRTNRPDAGAELYGADRQQ